MSFSLYNWCLNNTWVKGADHPPLSSDHAVKNPQVTLQVALWIHSSESAD